MIKRAFNLYVRITGLIGTLIAAWWTVETIGNPSNSIVHVFLYTGWLFSMLFPFPSYAGAVILLVLLYAFFCWLIAAYKDIHGAYTLLKSSENLNARKRLLFTGQYVWQWLCKLFIYVMSLFITFYLVFIIGAFVKSFTG